MFRKRNGRRLGFLARSRRRRSRRRRKRRKARKRRKMSKSWAKPHGRSEMLNYAAKLWMWWRWKRCRWMSNMGIRLPGMRMGRKADRPPHLCVLEPETVGFLPVVYHGTRRTNVL